MNSVKNRNKKWVDEFKVKDQFNTWCQTLSLALTKWSDEDLKKLLRRGLCVINCTKFDFSTDKDSCMYTEDKSLEQDAKAEWTKITDPDNYKKPKRTRETLNDNLLDQRVIFEDLMDPKRVCREQTKTEQNPL